MTKKRYYCDNELEYRSYGIFDLSKADKTMDDFRDEDGICSWQFGNYLVDETDSMLNGEEVVNRLNKQEERIKEYEKELKRCREWINSDKNDYEVTLAFIKNKGFSLQDVLNYEKTLKK